MRLWLEEKADKDRATRDAANPLHIAAGKGRLRVARLLLEANAEKGKAHQSGATPMSQLRRDSWRLCGFGWKRKRTRTGPRVMPPTRCTSQLAKGACRLLAYCWRPMPTRTRPTRVAPTPCIRRSSEWLVGGCAVFADSQREQGPLQSGTSPLYVALRKDSWRLCGCCCRPRRRRTRLVTVAPPPVYIAAQNGQLEVVWLFAGCQCGRGQGPPEWQNRVVNRSCGWSFGDHPLFAGAHNMDKIKAVNDGAD